MNQYTLQNLYNKGIIDYVPLELTAPTPAGGMTPMRNPYLDMAAQAGLYRNYGAGGDSFSYSGNNYAGNYSNQTGSQSNSFSNMFGLNGVGKNYTGGTGMYGNQGIGGNYTGGTGMNGSQGIGAQSQAGGVNMFGGFNDVQKTFSNGLQNGAAWYANTPNIIKGLIATALIIGGLAACFRGKKKPPVNTGNGENLWTKIRNVFKK